MAHVSVFACGIRTKDCGLQTTAKPNQTKAEVGANGLSIRGPLLGLGLILGLGGFWPKTDVLPPMELCSGGDDADVAADADARVNFD